MPKIAIMTDSNCGITPDDAQKYHIHILPMPVLVGEDTFYEGCNITSEEFYRKLSSGEPVTTSQPSPADVMKMWDQLLKEHDEVVHVPMSSGLSNSCQTALLLAQEEYFKGRVHLDAYTKTRGMKSAFKAMCKALDKDLSGRLSALHTQGLLKAGIAYTQMDPDTLEFFKEEMKKRCPDLELFQLPLTMSIGCHTGPGALGIGLVRVHK